MTFIGRSKLGQLYAGSAVACKIAMMQPFGKPRWLRRYADELSGHAPHFACCWSLLHTAMARRPTVPTAERDCWRGLAGQLRRVIYWQEQIIRGRALSKWDFSRYERQHRQLTQMLAVLGKQRFLWRVSWAETAKIRAERKPRRDPETVRQELKVNADLLRGVEGILRAGGVSLAERVLLGVPKTHGPDFDRLVPAILLSEHFRERDGKPHWRVVLRMLDQANWFDEKPETVRKMVGRIPAARRKEVYALYAALIRGSIGRRGPGSS